MTIVDWDALRRAAAEATERSYAPYSELRVGAAMALDDGTIVTGCNVENASYGLGVCAEVTAVGRYRMDDHVGKQIVAVAATDQYHRKLTPCGRCRQILMEHAGPDALIDGVRGPRPLRELLPDWFGPDDLTR